MKRETWILVVPLIMMVLSLLVNPVKAEELAKGFKFGLSEKMEIADTQKYLRPFKTGETLVGAGACYGPFFSTSYRGRWLADFLSVCTLGAVSETGEKTGTGGLDFINLLGIQGGLQYDPIKGKPFYTFGISVTGLAKQLLK